MSMMPAIPSLPARLRIAADFLDRHGLPDSIGLLYGSGPYGSIGLHTHRLGTRAMVREVTEIRACGRSRHGHLSPGIVVYWDGVADVRERYEQAWTLDQALDELAPDPAIPCPPTAAELEAGLHIAPPVSDSDRLSGEPLTVEANRAMDRLRGGAPRPEGA